MLFGSPFRLAWTAFAATMGLWRLGTARFMFPNILTEPPSKFKVGLPGLSAGQVATKWTAQYGVWVVNNEYNGKDLIYALRTVCTHLGCTPNWLEGEQKFKCPCHGSGFYMTGINFEGPARGRSERIAIRLADDGQIEVDKRQVPGRDGPVERPGVLRGGRLSVGRPARDAAISPGGAGRRFLVRPSS